MLYRLSLELGAEPGAVLGDALIGRVLVAQVQTCSGVRVAAVYPWVWELPRRHLRLIAKYAFNGGAEIAAQAW